MFLRIRWLGFGLTLQEYTPFLRPCAVMIDRDKVQIEI